MPQLDFIIAFPQIFWLIIVFFSLYTVLVHFFLPSFVKVLKARKQIIQENSLLLSTLENDYNSKQKTLTKVVENNLIQIKYFLENKVLASFSNSPLLDLELADKNIANALYSNILYYDSNILEAIQVKPNF